MSVPDFQSFRERHGIPDIKADTIPRPVGKTVIEYSDGSWYDPQRQHWYEPPDGRTLGLYQVQVVEYHLHTLLHDAFFIHRPDLWESLLSAYENAYLRNKQDPSLFSSQLANIVGSINPHCAEAFKNWPGVRSKLMFGNLEPIALGRMIERRIQHGPTLDGCVAAYRDSWSLVFGCGEFLDDVFFQHLMSVFKHVPFIVEALRRQPEVLSRLKVVLHPRAHANFAFQADFNRQQVLVYHQQLLVDRQQLLVQRHQLLIERQRRILTEDGARRLQNKINFMMHYGLTWYD